MWQLELGEIGWQKQSGGSVWILYGCGGGSFIGVEFSSMVGCNSRTGEEERSLSVDLLISLKNCGWF